MELDVFLPEEQHQAVQHAAMMGLQQKDVLVWAKTREHDDIEYAL